MQENRSIKVKIVKENARTVVVRFISLNRTMPVPKAEFDKRLESGLYEVVKQDELSPTDQE